jgi:ABC-2 type transport system permease protein
MMLPRSTDTPVVYDSSQGRTPVWSECRNLFRYRGLLRLLIHRDLTLRYKRSLLGVWWTLLNPLLTTAVMYVVFSNVFRFRIPGGVPFVVYLLSGVLVVTFFGQGVNNVGVSLVSSASVLTKVYVPPEIFAFSAAIASGVNFLVSLVPLLAVMLLAGMDISLTLLLALLPAFFLLCFVTGIGLLVATGAIRFRDTLDLAGIVVVLVGYLTPTFYPLEIVPEDFRAIVQANPLYSYVTVLRHLLYGGPGAESWNWVVVCGSGTIMLAIGTYVFSRSWRSTVPLL